MGLLTKLKKTFKKSSSSDQDSKIALGYKKLCDRELLDLKFSCSLIKTSLENMKKTNGKSNYEKRKAVAENSIKKIEKYYYDYINVRSLYFDCFGEEIEVTKQYIKELTESKGFIALENKPSTEVQVKNKIISQKNVARIINDIVGYEYLIWIKNGEHQNYSPTLDKNNSWKNELGISINIGISYAEPSAIDVTLPVAEIEQDKTINIQYYPSYASLSPECRRTYLNWIQSGFKDKVAVGYVFLYYYGLERFLLEEEHWERAFYDIVNFAILYPKISQYCKKELTFISLINNRLDLLDILDKNNLISYPIMAYLEYDNYTKVNCNTLFNCIECTNILTNKRYYKQDPELFYRTYIDLVKAKFEDDFIPLPKVENLSGVNIFTNSSINNNVSINQIPSIFSSEIILTCIQDIFMEVHEEVKILLTKSRTRRNKSN